MSTSASIASCSWCGASSRPLTRDGDGDLVCSDERTCGTATPAQRRPAVTATITLTAAPPRTLADLSDEAEAHALALVVTIRRSRREGHRGTRDVVEAQDRARRAVLDYHRATAGATAGAAARSAGR